MKLKLHIGTEKTGSSYLQTLLALNRKQLKESGVYYPNAGNREKDMISGKISPGNGKSLCLVLQEGKIERIKSLLSEFKLEAEKMECDIILLSNENLIEPLSNRKIYDKIVICCIECEIEWTDTLLVLRDPVDQALSLYKHRSKNGRSAPIQDWIEEGYTLTLFLNNYLSILDDKKVKCSIRKYSDDGNTMQHILFKDWLQIGGAEISLHQRVNPSLTISELLLLREIAMKNGRWIKPFYERMLGIPLQDKENKDGLSVYYRKQISNKLVNYKHIWSKCNDYLIADEKLDVPIKHEIGPNEFEVLSFSVKQAKQIIEFLSEVNTKQLFFKNLLKRVKRNLVDKY